MRAGTFGLLGAVACALVPAGAPAEGGRVEISETCAAVGCFGGDAPGYPVTVAAPGSYLLTSDLVLPAATSGIVLEADDVHVDLNGFSIRGPANCQPLACSPSPGTSVGVGKIPYAVATGGNRCSVRNGSIVGIDGTGIHLSRPARVERVFVSHATERGIWIPNGDGYVVDSSVDSVGMDGIAVGVSSLVRNNVITRSGLGAGGGRSIAGPPGQGNACDDGRCTRYRRYYLSKNVADGASALTACDAGFHMASLWEIHDTSQLTYDVTLGRVAADSGFGPVSDRTLGWIRNGSFSYEDDLYPQNCNAWTSASSGGLGARVRLTDLYTPLPATMFAPWEMTVSSCATLSAVWCVED